jgi:hypothetical protein
LLRYFGEASFGLLEFAQGLLSTALQLGGDQAVVRIKCCRQHLIRYVTSVLM